MADENKEFVEGFRKFYEMFFLCLSDSVCHLANVQKKFPNQFDKIREFAQNPKALEDLLESLSVEEKAKLFTILFTAGEFGMRFATLMESEAKDKKEFADDLKKFAKKLKEL